MIPRPFASVLTETTDRDLQVIEGYWLANRDDLRWNTARIEQRLDATLDEIAVELDGAKAAIAESRQHRQTIVDARFDALRAEVTASESLWQRTKEITPIVLMFLPFPLALMAILASITGGPS